MKKKNQELIKIIYFLFAVIIVLLVLTVVFKIKKDNNVRYNEKLYLSKAEAENYLDYVPFVNDSNSLFLEDAYHGDKRNINNIRLDNVFVKAFDNSEKNESNLENTTKCVDEMVFINNLRKMYNVDIKINNFIYKNGEVKRVNEMYCSYNTSNNEEKTKISSLVSYKVKSDSLTIKERAAFVSKDGDVYKVYKTTSKDSAVNKSFNTMYEAVEYINDNMDSFNIFNHEFSGEDGLYHYESTDVLK